MIDNIKITLADFSGNFNKCVFLTEGEYDDFYMLPSHGNLSPSALFIRQNRETKKVVIVRSIRKWYYNKGTLLDLTSVSFVKAMKLLAEDLSIPMSELCEGKISQCEIGQNVRMSFPATEILPQIVGYGRLKKFKRIKDETLYYNGSAKKLIIYDKLAEISAKGKASQKRAMRTLRNTGNYFLRIEFKLYDHESFKQHHMGYINTVGDLITSYRNLYEFWTWQIGHLVFSMPIKMDMRYMKKKEYLIGLGIKYLGYEQFVNNYLSLCKSKSLKGLKTARSRAKKEVLDVMRKYALPAEGSGKLSFMFDIEKHLQRKSKQEKLSLPLLHRNLQGLHKL